MDFGTHLRTASLLLASLCLLNAVEGAVSPQGHRMEAWSAGKASWRMARKATGSQRVWDRPNSCNPEVLRSSGPLTVLFGLSNIWERIKQRREAEGRTAEPLEVHVLGASYPFEGRSDWSLLNKQRPPEITRLRVTLVLGTPFQVDNVPPLSKKARALVEVEGAISPDAGKWSDEKEDIICKGKGAYGTDDLDKAWSKEDVCRDHGNGLEVICLEKFYQDVREELAKPDLAVMFSPGFPQFVRRSWDAVLIGLLNSRIPLVLSDVIQTDSWGYKLNLPEVSRKPIAPGGRWKPSAHMGEEWQTWMAMRNYKAMKLIARRNPFPILHGENGGILAKNAVVQIYEGYKPNEKPTPPLSLDAIRKFKDRFDSVNWTDIGHTSCDVDDIDGAVGVKELRRIYSDYKFPTSRAFDMAVRDMYKDSIRERLRHTVALNLTDGERGWLEQYGLMKSKGKTKYRKKPLGTL